MNATTPFILVTEDNEYVMDSTIQKLTLHLYEAAVFGRLENEEASRILERSVKAKYESVLARTFIVASVKTDSDGRACKRLF